MVFLSERWYLKTYSAAEAFVKFTVRQIHLSSEEIRPYQQNCAENVIITKKVEKVLIMKCIVTILQKNTLL